MTVLTYLVTAAVIALAVAVYVLPVPIPYAIALPVMSFSRKCPLSHHKRKSYGSQTWAPTGNVWARGALASP